MARKGNRNPRGTSRKPRTGGARGRASTPGGGGGGGTVGNLTAFNTYVATLAPDHWHKADDASGNLVNYGVSGLALLANSSPLYAKAIGVFPAVETDGVSYFQSNSLSFGTNGRFSTAIMISPDVVPGVGAYKIIENGAGGSTPIAHASLTFAIGDGGKLFAMLNSISVASAAGLIVAGGTYLIGCTFDNVNLKIFINGALVGSVACVTATSSTGFGLGKETNNSNPAVWGVYDGKWANHLRSQNNAQWNDAQMAALHAASGLGGSGVGVAGYYAGGGDNTTVTDRWAFPADTRTTLATGLSSGRNSAVGFENKLVAGYSVGGFTTGWTCVATVDKFTFPSDTRSTLGTGLSVARVPNAGFADPGVAGYSAGGDNTPTSNFVTTTEKFAFPTDVRSSVSAGISTAIAGGVGFANPAVAGYSAGGHNSGTCFPTVDKFAFPADTRTTLATGLSAGEKALGGFANPATAGYTTGGATQANTPRSTIEKFAFPSDTRTLLGVGLTSARSFTAGFSNTTVAGYAASGSTGSDVTTVDKMPFSTEVCAAISAGTSTLASAGVGFAQTSA